MSRSSAEPASALANRPTGLRPPHPAALSCRLLFANIIPLDQYNSIRFRIVSFKPLSRRRRQPEAEAVHRSTVTKARAKLPWTAFEQVHPDAVRLAYTLWPASE